MYNYIISYVACCILVFSNVYVLCSLLVYLMLYNKFVLLYIWLYWNISLLYNCYVTCYITYCVGALDGYIAMS